MKKSKYEIDDRVSFTLDNIVITGTVVVVDTYGTFENPNEVSYDIIAVWEGRDTLFKHIGEHMILKKV